MWFCYYLGVYNGDDTDDFVEPDGSVPQPADGKNLTDREIFEYGEKCKLWFCGLLTLAVLVCIILLTSVNNNSDNIRMLCFEVRFIMTNQVDSHGSQARFRLQQCC